LIRGYWFFLFASFVPFCGYSFFVLAFAALADVAKGGDGAKSALRQIFLLLASYAEPRIADPLTHAFV
jgi:hypothetical protein